MTVIKKNHRLKLFETLYTYEINLWSEYQFAHEFIFFQYSILQIQYVWYNYIGFVDLLLAYLKLLVKNVQITMVQSVQTIFQPTSWEHDKTLTNNMYLNRICRYYTKNPCVLLCIDNFMDFVYEFKTFFLN